MKKAVEYRIRQDNKYEEVYSFTIDELVTLITAFQTSDPLDEKHVNYPTTKDGWALDVNECTAHIIPSFGHIYRCPQRSDIQRCVMISVHIVSAVVALKVLIGSFSNMFTCAARLARVTRVNRNTFHTVKQSLVFNLFTQVAKIPFSKFSPKFLVSSFTCKSNASKVFNSDTPTLLFSRLNNRFCNSVINYGTVSSFLAGKPFQKFTRTSCVFALNRTPNLLPMFTVCVKPIGRVLNTVRSGYNRIYAKIHTHERFNIFDFFLGHVNGLKKVKFAFLVNQIGFTFNVRQVVSVMANKWYFNPASDSPKRNNIIRLVCHNPIVITNTAKWSKFTLNFFVKFVSISNFCNTSYQYLAAKFKGGFVAMVNFVMQFKVVENFLSPSHIRNGITNSISLLHRFEKQVGLFIGRQKFYFQRQFHDSKIQLFSDIRKYLIEFINQRRNLGQFLPLPKGEGVSLLPII